jgi:hypothetical protein
MKLGRSPVLDSGEFDGGVGAASFAVTVFLPFVDGTENVPLQFHQNSMLMRNGTISVQLLS